MKIKSLFLSLVLGFGFLLGVGSLTAQPQTLSAIVDTITNTEVDTVSLGYVLDAKGDIYDVSYHMVTRQLSGTTNVTAKHIVSNASSGNAWVITADSLDLDGAASGLLQVNALRNTRSGVRIVGTGTQSTEYTIYPRLIRRE